MRNENGQFASGTSGNPNGRPQKKRTLTEILAKHGSKRDQTGADGRKLSRKEALAEALWTLALTPDFAAMKYIFDRIDGTPTETVRHSGGDGGPILVDYTAAREKLLNAISEPPKWP